MPGGSTVISEVRNKGKSSWRGSFFRYFFEHAKKYQSYRCYSEKMFLESEEHSLLNFFERRDHRIRLRNDGGIGIKCGRKAHVAEDRRLAVGVGTLLAHGI